MSRFGIRDLIGAPRVPLDEVCAKRTGTRDPRREPDMRFSYVDITSVDASTKQVTSPKLLLGIDAPSRARKIICSRDVIVSTTRPNLNAVALIPSELHGQICSTGFCVLRCQDGLDPDFLFEYVQCRQFVDALSALVKGAMYPAVTDAQVRSLRIPLPPIQVQRRIAANLKERLAAIERARRAVEEQAGAANTLIDSIVRESLCDGTTRLLPLGDCLTEVKYGVGADWSRYPVLGATRAGIAAAKEPVGKSPQRYKLADPVTVFYNPMRILLGSIAMVDDGDPPGITSPDYVVVKGRPGVLDTRWFYYWFRSGHGDQLIRSLSRGAVRERILYNRLASAVVAFPDFRVQKRASERLRKVRQLSLSVDEQLDSIRALPATVLRIAFNGGS